MIDTKELRLGNWVRLISVTDDNNYQIVDSIANCSPYRSVGLAGNLIVNYADQIDAIPLTPEIIEKCGFKRSSVNIFEHDDLSIKIAISLPGENGYEKGRLYMKSWFIMEPPKYLHTFQNIYYALTQTELNISL